MRSPKHTLPRLLGMAALMAVSCVATDAFGDIFIEEVGGGLDEAVEEAIFEDVAARQATEFALLEDEEVPITATSTLPSPTSTPVPETVELETDQAYTGPIEYFDPHADCHHFNRDPADCPLGIDMERILVGMARTDTELADWLRVALEKGYGVGEIQFTEPMVIISVIINDFDPAAGNLCAIWASPQENLTPSVSGANVVQTCTFADSLTYTTRINANGERNTEFGEAGPIGQSDLKTGITLFQPLGSLFREDTLIPFSIHMNNNEGTVLDSVSVDNLLNYFEPEP